MNTDKILSDCKNLAYLYLIALVLFKLLFINESISNTALAVSAFFWLFVLPGFFMADVFGINEFFERLIIGILLGGALVGISAYYLGIIGFHVRYSAIILPPVFIAVSIWLSYSKPTVNT
ncbi:Uncharacterised protein [uncultured archaeon]|nr:Uncharacterised protein [uncultured archaeon]